MMFGASAAAGGATGAADCNLFVATAFLATTLRFLVIAAFLPAVLNFRVFAARCAIERRPPARSFTVAMAFLAAALRFLVCAAFLPAALNFRLRAAFVAARLRFVSMGIPFWKSNIWRRPYTHSLSCIQVRRRSMQIRQSLRGWAQHEGIGVLRLRSSGKL
jgi:hypothetical protein